MTTHHRARRSLRAAITAIAAVAVLLLGTAPAVAEEVAAATIAGTVTSDADGAPVEGVLVVAQTEDAGSIHTAYTDADGRYLIEGVTAGDYRVKFEVWGANLVGEYWENTRDWSQATVLQIAEGSATTGIDAGLAAGAVIAGTVTRSADGTPVEGIRVTASGESHGTAWTAADGTYRIEGLAPGGHTVEFDAAEGLVGEYWNDARTWDAAEQIELSAGQQAEGIDAALEAGGGIAGTVTTESGEPVSAGSVRFFAGPDAIDPVATTWLSENGSYSAQGLPVGEYLVQFIGATGQQSEYWDDAQAAKDATPVPVVAGQVTGSIDAQLAASAQISGTVTSEGDGAAVAGTVSASSTDGGESQMAWIDEEGGYVLDVQPGTYVLHFQPYDQGLLGEYWNDSATAAGASSITVGSGEQVTGIDAQLATAALITGTVHLDSGEDHEQFVEAFTTRGELAGMAYASTEDGSYTLALPAGTYTLRASAIFYNHSRTTAKPQYWQGASNAKKATKLTADAGETLTGIDFTLVAKTKGKN